MTNYRATVLYFDDDLHERGKYQKYWQDVFSFAGIEAQVVFEPDWRKLSDHLLERPEIVVVDNHALLPDEAGRVGEMNNAGLVFISRCKEDYPDVLFVLYSGEGFSLNRLGTHTPNPDLLVTKTYLNHEVYRRYLGGVIRSRVFRLHISDCIIEGPRPDDMPSEYELRSLVGQVGFEQFAGKRESWPSRVHLVLLTPGYSGACVFRMRLGDFSAATTLDVILKVGRVGDIEREVRNFNLHAKWFLPHNIRVDIIGTGRVKDWGAISYAFALGGGGETATLATELRKGDEGALGSVRELLFRTQSVGWYREPRQSGRGLRDYFGNLSEYPADKDEWRDDCLRSAASAIARADGVDVHISDDWIRIGAIECRSLRSSLRSLGEAEVLEARCHGDLNANNVFVNESHTAIALIDFDSAGFHYLFRDHVSLESSVRSLSVQDADIPLAELLRFEALIHQLVTSDVEDCGGCPPALEQVLLLRRIAYQEHSDANWAVYDVGLALHCYKLLGFRDLPSGPSEWGPIGDRLLLSALISSLQRVGGGEAVSNPGACPS